MWASWLCLTPGYRCVRAQSADLISQPSLLNVSQCLSLAVCQAFNVRIMGRVPVQEVPSWHHQTLHLMLAMAPKESTCCAQALSDLSKSVQIVPTSVEFVDIAGLVKGASKGEGLGNQFLANIRECDAIAQVQRDPA